MTTKTTNAAKDLLKSLKPTSKKVTTKKSDRPEVELPQAYRQEFVEFCAAKSLSKVVDARVESSKESLSAVIFEKWTEALWNGKARPANPGLSVERLDGKTDCSAVFQVKDRATVGNPFPVDGDDDLEDAFKNGFAAILEAEGVGSTEARDMAERLVDNEFLLSPDTSIDLKKLLIGSMQGEGKNRSWVDASDEDRAIGAKILALLKQRVDDDDTDLSDYFLTDEEMQEALVQKNVMQVKKGFLDRAAGYVNSLSQLRAILAVVKPILVFQPVKFAVSDTPEQANKRLAAFVKDDVLGV